MLRGNSEVRDARRAVQNRPIVLDSLLPPQASSGGGMGSLATDSRPPSCNNRDADAILDTLRPVSNAMNASAPNNVGASDSVSGWSPTIWGLGIC